MSSQWKQSTETHTSITISVWASIFGNWFCVINLFNSYYSTHARLTKQPKTLWNPKQWMGLNLQANQDLATPHDRARKELQNMYFRYEIRHSEHKLRALKDSNQNGWISGKSVRCYSVACTHISLLVIGIKQLVSWSVKWLEQQLQWSPWQHAQPEIL